jgi:protoporphyrinogen/coproporphyrinogen III oxidase
MGNHRAAIVIGAGISGLVCAYRLKTLGVDVLLIEKNDCVGGVIQSENIDGFLIERGPNSSQGTEELLALVEELGILDELIEGNPKAPAYVYFKGRLHPVPSGPGSFLKSDLLSPSGKLRILKEPFVPRRNHRSEESVAAFARRRIGNEAAERMVAPFVSGIYAGDADRLSVKAAFPRLANLEINYGGLFRGMFAKAREVRRAKKNAGAVLDKAAPTRRRLCSFRNGMAFLPKVLASKLGEDLLTGCTELRVSRAPDFRTFTLEFEREGNRHQLSADHLIIATPSDIAGSLIAPISTEMSNLLNEIEYPPLSIVNLAYETSTVSTSLNGFGFLVPPSEKMNILGCVWNSSLFTNRAPNGTSLLTSFVGGARNSAAAQCADAELVSTVHGELQQVLGISSEPRVISITRYQRSIPQYNIGHFDRVQRIETLLVGAAGLQLIGNYLHGVSTGDCIKEAERVAKAVAEFLE